MKKLRQYVPALLLLGLVVFTAAIWYVLLHEDRRGLLTVAVLDIGQGDAIFIEAPNGNQILIDGGPDSSVLRSMSALLPFYDRSIDMLVVSNPDKDHIAGFIDVLKRFTVGMEVEPGTVSTTAIYAALRDAVKAEGLTPILPKAGDRFVLDRERGVSFEVLFPDRDVSGLSTNDGSLVGKLSYGNVCAILTGDTTKGIEEYLVHFYGNILHCQLLKVAHHGSKTSSSPSFVAAVSPTYAAISDGKNNKYGHPHKETLDTLNNLGVKILRTDEIGTIIFQTDGRDLWHK